MVKYVIDELKREKETLENDLHSIVNTINTIECRGIIKINSGDLSNGIYLTKQEFCYEDILQSLKTVRTRHKSQISYINNILLGLEEE